MYDSKLDKISVSMIFECPKEVFVASYKNFSAGSQVFLTVYLLTHCLPIAILLGQMSRDS